MDKIDLINRLNKLGAFWSYDLNNTEKFSDNVLIEECLKWGDVIEINEVLRIFPIKKIKEVWKEKLIPDLRLYSHNYYLAIIFFDIKNPELYIKINSKKYSRYERIKKLA